MIRVAVLGAGIGREHLAGYAALADRFEVKIVCDRDLERAAKIASEGMAVVGDLETAIGHPDIDLIDICLPPHLHAATSVAALAAGKHVVCEKPMAISLAEAETVATAVAASGKVFSPVFQYRFGPAFDRLEALIAAGLTGPPVVASLETHWDRDADYYAAPWRGTWAGEAGGAVLSHAIHAHDLLCHYFGEVRGVQAFAGTQVNPIETEDCAAISFAFTNGAFATSSITLGAAGNSTRLRLVFRDLTATSGDLPYAPGEGAWTFQARDPARQAQVDAVRPASAGSGFIGYLAALADAIDGKPNRAVTLHDGLRSIELATAIYAAARGQTGLALPLPADHPMRSGWRPKAAP